MLVTEAVLIAGLTRGIWRSVLQDRQVKAAHRNTAALRHRRIESRSVGIHVGQRGSFIGAEPYDREC